MITRKISNYLENSGPFFIAVCCIAISALLFTPNITLYNNYASNSTLNYIVKQAEHPFVMHEYESNFAHEAKLGLRLTVPLLLKFLFVNNHVITFYILYFLKLLLGSFFFSHIYKTLIKIGCSKKLSTLLLLNFTVIYLGYSFSRNIVHFDEIAYFLIYFSWVHKRIFIQSLCVFLAVFTDERAVFSIVLLILMQIILDKSISTRLLGVTVVLISTLILRQFIGNVFDLFPRNSGGGIVPFQLIREMRVSEIILGLFFSFKLLWIFFIYTRQRVFNESHKIIWYFFVTLVSGYLLIGFSVIDVTRTVTYLFPIILFPLIRFGIPAKFSVYGLVIPSDVLLILNLMIPSVHVETSINLPANILIKIISFKFGLIPT
jgi:hypothetical protein